MSPTPAKAEQDRDHVDVTAELDRVSLAQALQDVEIANSRVMDLTQRLIAANDEIVVLRRRIDDVQLAHQELSTEHHAMRESAAFRIADRVWALRNLLRR